MTCTATIAYVGNTSMDVYVRVDSEDMESGNGPEKALCAHFTMVAMSKTGKTTEGSSIYARDRGRKRAV